MKWIALSITLCMAMYVFLNVTLEQRIDQRMADIQREKCRQTDQLCLKLEEGMCYFMKRMNGCAE